VLATVCYVIFFQHQTYFDASEFHQANISGMVMDCNQWLLFTGVCNTAGVANVVYA
jgi:hypothetical protein